MLKYKLASLDGLPEELKALYAEKDGEFILQVDGIEDASGLKKALEVERGDIKKMTAKITELTEAVEAKQAELDDMRRGAIPKNDVEALEASWKAKYEKLERESSEKLTVANSTLDQLLVDNVATTLAQKISTAPGLILPHIKSRLKVENVDGKATTRVLDSTGTPSALTIDELEKELIANKDFSAIIIGSKASGGGAAPKPSGGGADHGKAPNLADANPSDIVAHIKNKQGGQ